MGSSSTTMQAKAGTARVRAKAGAAPIQGKIATITVGELRSNFKSVEAKLAEGLRVQVTRRGAVVAELVGPAEQVAEARNSAGRMPDFMARMKELWGPTPLDVDTTAMVLEGRDRDFLS